ncbi:MAG: tRNA preQ1(34) S-adenosylmethionine ribosyltransferase-isomerase QueA [Clostridia bacterium]|nr:tRNA preQ1(34) S-adenosylmethionine ribosyltransferase-isomerase QueA [Clostridia bacterium]
MLLKDFDYVLPEELIAQYPLDRRDRSRLLVLERAANRLHHVGFTDLPAWLNPNDLLVFNDTRVIPARLWAKRLPGGGRTEVLLLHPKGENEWEALVRPGRKVRPGQRLVFGGEKELAAEVVARTPAGGRVLRFNRHGDELRACFEELGEVPLPPYIKEPGRAERVRMRERYQTVYARYEGSAAAPTAGLHFTPELLAAVRERGVRTVFLTLHIGLDTFRPVKTEQIEEHKMHSEEFRISPEVAEAVAAAKAAGGRVIAVGTTATRALESAARENGEVVPGTGRTELFIYPGYRFKVVDALLTNFHLPRSTLLMLVCAFAGRERVLAAYEEAVRRRYRFFSFGDAMLIV